MENNSKRKYCYRGLDVGKRFGGRVVLGTHPREEGIKSEPYRIGKSPNARITCPFCELQIPVHQFYMTIIH